MPHLGRDRFQSIAMLDAFIRHPFMSRAGVAACSPRDFLAAMCRVECALARVQERAGLVPAGTAAAIESRPRTV